MERPQDRDEGNQGQRQPRNTMPSDLIKAGLRSRLLAHLREVVRERDPYRAPEGHSYVKNYLRRELARWGKVDLHTFEHLGTTHENLVLNLAGQQDQGLILIGAHYDTVPGSPGADDNGTAIAVLLEDHAARAQRASGRAVCHLG